MTDDLLARARAEAEKKYPRGPEMYFGFEVEAAIWMAEWLLSQLPDREAVAERIATYIAHPGFSVYDAADAVLDLIRNGATK